MTRVAAIDCGTNSIRLLIADLTDDGVEGAIIGKALYAGRFTLPQALDAVRS